MRGGKGREVGMGERCNVQVVKINIGYLFYLEVKRQILGGETYFGMFGLK